MNKVIQSLVIAALIVLMIGAFGYFVPTVEDNMLSPWFTVAGMLATVALLLAIFTEE